MKLINANYPSMSESERHLLHYITQHIDLLPNLSIIKLSEEANVSTATIVRTMKKLGFNGFTDFKIRLKDENETNPRFAIIEQVDQEIQTAILKNALEVTKTIQLLESGTIEDTVQKIRHAKRVILLARGFSEMIAQEMQVKLQLLNTYCEMYSDPNIIRIVSTRLNPDDVIICVSLSGETSELVEAAQNCQAQKVTCISLTCSPTSKLAVLSELNFTGYKSEDSLIPDYEVRSRLPLQVMARILLDAYAIRTAHTKNQ